MEQIYINIITTLLLEYHHYDSYSKLLLLSISVSFFKNPSFLKKFQEKSLSANAKGLEISKLPQQDDFRTFCMSEDSEEVYRELVELIGIC